MGDTSNINIYFSVGEAIAAIGLLLAMIALSNPSRQFRWKVSWFFRLSSAYFLFFLGVLFVLLAAWIPSLSKEGLIFGPYKIPLLWETFAAIFFLGGIVGLIWVGDKPIKFSKKNSKRFFDESYSIIASGEKEKIMALADEIQFSAKKIVSACQNEEQRIKTNPDTNIPASEYTKWCFNILNLFSDSLLCRFIVLHNPQTAFVYLDEIKKIPLKRTKAGAEFVHQLIIEAFKNKESVLYRNTPFVNFTHSICTDYEFVSTYNPLNIYPEILSDVSSIEKYGECIITLFGKHLTALSINKSLFYNEFDIINSRVRHLILVQNKEILDSNFSGDPFVGISIISDVYAEIVRIIVFDEEDLHNQVYEFISEKLLDFIGAISMLTSFSHIIIKRLSKFFELIYPISDEDENVKIVEIQKRLEPKIFEIVERNLTRKKAAYPMVTRFLISFLGLSKENYSSGKVRLFDKLTKELKEKFHSASLLDEDRVQELLPEGYEYDAENRKIIHKNKFSDSTFIFECDADNGSKKTHIFKLRELSRKRLSKKRFTYRRKLPSRRKNLRNIKKNAFNCYMSEDENFLEERE